MLPFVPGAKGRPAAAGARAPAGSATGKAPAAIREPGGYYRRIRWLYRESGGVTSRIRRPSPVHPAASPAASGGHHRCIRRRRQPHPAALPPNRTYPPIRDLFFGGTGRGTRSLRKIWASWNFGRRKPAPYLPKGPELPRHRRQARHANRQLWDITDGMRRPPVRWHRTAAARRKLTSLWYTSLSARVHTVIELIVASDRFARLFGFAVNYAALTYLFTGLVARIRMRLPLLPHSAAAGAPARGGGHADGFELIRPRSHDADRTAGRPA